MNANRNVSMIIYGRIRQFILLITIIFFVSCLDSTKHSSKNIILFEINNINNLLLNYKIQNGSFPETNEKHEEQNNSLIKKILKIKNFDNDLFIDLWGNPYHIYLDINNDQIIKIDDKQYSANIIIWSDGPNTINEYGAGDDIIFIWKD